MKLTEWKYVDKLQHFGIAAGISAVVLHLGATLMVTVAGIAVLAVAKELYDAQHPEAHTADPWDAFWTVAGGLYAGLAFRLLC